MSEPKVYRGDGLSVRFDAARCIHAARCVHGLPAVFDPQARPWVQPLKAAATEVAEVVARCPTGALQALHDDGSAAEQPDPHNTLQLVADGPLHLRGDIARCDADGQLLSRETRLALCRCGASANKPFCDNSHVGAGFRHDGSCAEGELAPLGTGPLRVTPTRDGPLHCQGPLQLVDAFGTPVAQTAETWLCRCGRSGNKPYCDGSHKAAGFRG